MSIRLRGSVYQIDVVGPDGQQHKISAQTGDKRQARLKEAEFYVSLWKNPVIDNSPVTFESLAELYQAKMQGKKSYSDFHQPYSNGLCQVFRSKRLAEITVALIEDYRDKRLASRKTGTVRNSLAVLKAMFFFAKRRGLFSGENPVSSVEFPRKNEPRERHLNPEERLAYLKALPEKIFKAFLVSELTGMRRGELIRLQKKHVDLDRWTLLLEQTKSGKPRRVPIPPAIRPLIVEIVKGLGEEDFLWTTRYGRPYQSRGFREVHIRACRDAGLDYHGFHWHDIRHMFGRSFMEQAKDIYALRAILGHATVAQTESYSKLSPEYLAAQVESFDRGTVHRTREALALNKRRIEKGKTVD